MLHLNRLVVEHASRWAAITSIAEKIGCATETLRSWARQAERNAGKRPGVMTDEQARLKQLKRVVGLFENPQPGYGVSRSR